MYAADLTQPTILGSLTNAPSGNTITVQIVRGLVNIGDQISFISQARGVIYFSTRKLFRITADRFYRARHK